MILFRKLILVAFALVGGVALLSAQDELVSRLVENPERLAPDLRESVVALGRTEASIKKIWRKDYRPEQGATDKEIDEARRQFRSDYAEQIRASKRLRLAVIREVKSSIREAINDSEWDVEARSVYGDYTKSQTDLRNAWRSARQGLGSGASREQVAAAKRQFQKDNAALIEAQKERAKDLRLMLRESRDEFRADREPLGDDLQKLRSDMNRLRDDFRQSQGPTRVERNKLTYAERVRIRRELSDNLRDLQDELRNRRRQIIDGIRDREDGPRRPEG